MVKYSRLPDITPNYKNSRILFVMSRSQVRVPSQAPARCPRSRFRGSDVLSREFFSRSIAGLNRSTYTTTGELIEKIRECLESNEDIESLAYQNLKTMDKLLEMRKLNITEDEAMHSSDALIAYINQSENGRWVINHYSCLSNAEKEIFIKGMNQVLPYVANRENFISFIKHSMKQDFCEKIDFDCWLNDSNAYGTGDMILTKEGFKIIGYKYSKEINEFYQDMADSAAEDNNNSKHNMDWSVDLPFDEEELAQSL